MVTNQTCLVFVYLGNSLSLLLFWMTALLDRVFLAAYFPHSACWIYHATPFCPAKFLWTDMLWTWSVFPCRLRTFLPCCSHDSLLVYVFCEFDYMICLGGGWLLLNLMGVFCASWILKSVFFPRLGKFSAIICSPILFATFSLHLLGLLWYECYYILINHWVP